MQASFSPLYFMFIMRNWVSRSTNYATWFLEVFSLFPKSIIKHLFLVFVTILSHFCVICGSVIPKIIWIRNIVLLCHKLIVMNCNNPSKLSKQKNLMINYCHLFVDTLMLNIIILYSFYNYNSIAFCTQQQVGSIKNWYKLRWKWKEFGKCSLHWV